MAEGKMGEVNNQFMEEMHENIFLLLPLSIDLWKHDYISIS